MTSGIQKILCCEVTVVLSTNQCSETLTNQKNVEFIQNKTEGMTEGVSKYVLSIIEVNVKI